MLLSDYEVSINEELKKILNNAIGGVHLETDAFTIKDLSYIALCKEFLT
jgi:hypothetical protein